jgi:integrase
VTHLRKMMLEELERRNYSASTIRYYLRFVERFAQHFGKSPDKLGPEHLRTYHAYLLKQRKLSPGSVENHVAALRFFYLRTLHRHEFRQFLPYPKVPRKLPNILSREEVARLIEASSSLFQRTLLMVLYGMHSALPVDREVKRCLRLIGADDDLFKYGSEDHLLKFRRAAIAFPYRRKVLAHRPDLRLFLSGQRMPHSIELGKPVFCPRYFLQLLVPATFELAGHQPIPGVYGIVLFKGLPSFILQLLELTG